MKHRIQACGCETDRRAYLARPDKTPTGRGAHLHCLNIFCISCNVCLRDRRLWLIRIWNFFFSISVLLLKAWPFNNPESARGCFYFCCPDDVGTCGTLVVPYLLPFAFTRYPPFQLKFFLIICICKNPKFRQIGISLKFQPPWCLHDNNFSAFSSNPSISTSPGIGDSPYLPWWGHLGGGLALHPPCCCPGSPLLNTTEHLAVMAL